MRRRITPQARTSRKQAARHAKCWPAIGRLLTTLLALSLCAQTSLAGTVTDSGEVVVDATNNLLIGTNTIGSRTVDAADDGPYTSVTVGQNPGSSGTLTLDNSASLSTPGQLSVGNEGSGRVEVLGGSQLSSGTASLRADFISLGSPSPSDVVVSGEGSTWANAGLLEIFLSYYRPARVTMRVADGASFSTNGIYSGGGGDSHYEIIVEGPGSLLTNSDRLSLQGQYQSDGDVPKLTIRDGATMTDFGASLLGTPHHSGFGMLVTDPGSRWSSGDVLLNGAHLVISNGGTVEAASLRIWETELGSSGSSIAGEGSLLDLSGSLSASNTSGPVSFVVGGGAHVVSHGAMIGISAGKVSVTDSGSTWDNYGDTRIGLGPYGPEFSITGGGRVFNQNASYGASTCASSAYSCRGVTVSDPGSLWHTAGDLSVDGPMAVDNGGIVFVGNRLDVRGRGRINLDDGFVTADIFSLDRGSLTGQGVIAGDVTNGSVVDLGIPDTSIAGVISIDGNYEQTNTGLLNIMLDDELAGGSDLLAVLGTAVLDGELAITLADGFLPEVGDVFFVLGYESRVGEFAQISGLALGDGISLRPVYGGRGMSLVTIPEPSTALLVGIGLVGFAAARRIGMRLSAAYGTCQRR